MNVERKGTQAGYRVSVVLPVLNEEGNLPELYRAAFRGAPAMGL